MEIYAKGKNIATFPFSKLFVCGEKFADTITFYIERFYEGKDLSECSFLMRGVNENSEEAQQAIIPEVCGDLLALRWRVSNYFTAAAGKLELELTASRINDDEEAELIVKYAMPPVYVNPSPSGENTVLPDVAEQAVSDISAAVSAGLVQIQTLIDNFDLSAVQQRLDDMDSNIDIFLARPEVIPVTQSEYDSIVHKENALYVIVKE